MSPFGAVSRNRGSRNPLAYNSILKPGGTLGCASAGRSTTCARLIARTFEPGGGKSCTVILRLTPGASLVQSPIAALPVRTAPFSAAAASYNDDDENSREKDCAQNWIARLASFHFSGIVRGVKYRADSNHAAAESMCSQRRYSSCVFQDRDD